MPGVQDPNMGLWYGYDDDESGWGDQVSANFLKIGTLMQIGVISRTLTAPPSSLANGDTYIPATGATGAWVGKENQIAVWRAPDTAWEFYVPKNGWSAYVSSEQIFYVFASSVWSKVSSRVVENYLVNGHLRFDNYHDPNVAVNQMVLQRDIVADAVLYGWGGDPYVVNTATQNTLNLRVDNPPPDAVGKAVKFSVTAAGPINSTGDSEYHHHFRLIVPPERLKEIADNGGGFFRFKVKSNHNATYSVTSLNWTRTRGFVREFTVTNDGAWRDIILWFPIDNAEIVNSGWLTSPEPNGDGYGISFRVLLGIRNDSTHIATPGAWTSGNILGSLVSDFGANASNEISFADFRFGLGPTISAKDFHSDKAEVETYCYGHSSNKNSRTALCQVNTGWIAEFNFNPAIEFRKTPARIFVLGAISAGNQTGTDGDYRVQNSMGGGVRVDTSKLVLSSLLPTRNPLIRFSYSSGGNTIGPSMKSQIRLPVASYISSGINLSGPGQFAMRITPYVANTVALNGNYATQADFLAAIAAIPGVESAVVSGSDLVITTTHSGEDSFVYISEFTIPDGLGGTIDLLDVTKVYQSPPLRGISPGWDLNIQMIRAAVLGEAQGRKPLFYWDAVP